MTVRVGVAGAGAVSPMGLGWRGLGRALVAGRPLGSTSAPHGVPDIAAEHDVGDHRQRRLMSQPARFAAIAMRDALADAGFAEGRSAIGCFLGVGASSARIDDFLPLVRASIESGRFSVEAFGRRGLSACNPLLTFQLLNNFTMCHGAILEALGGPNAAFYSRGSGTVTALAEAVSAIRAGECDQALAGGSDCASHPVTRAELQRDGFEGRGLVASDGAAVLALSASVPAAGTTVEHVSTHSGRARPGPRAIGAAIDALPGTPDVVVLAPWGPEVAAELREGVARAHPQVATLDGSALLGDALAAGPALGWAAALDLLAARGSGRAWILSAGIDGDIGAVCLARGEPS